MREKKLETLELKNTISDKKTQWIHSSSSEKDRGKSLDGEPGRLKGGEDRDGVTRTAAPRRSGRNKSQRPHRPSPGGEGQRGGKFLGK